MMPNDSSLLEAFQSYQEARRARRSTGNPKQDDAILDAIRQGMLFLEEAARIERFRLDAYGRGVASARAAASYIEIDTGTTINGHNSAPKLLQMIEDDDPEVWDHLPPAPALDGQWADDATPLSLAREITDTEDPRAELVDELADAFEDGVNDEYGPACERRLRFLAGQEG